MWKNGMSAFSVGYSMGNGIGLSECYWSVNFGNCMLVFKNSTLNDAFIRQNRPKMAFPKRIGMP
jgi:hypothetical protein